MIPRTQSATGQFGRCFPACLASILELPEAAVPSFFEAEEREFFEAVNKFLAPWGLTYVKDKIAPLGWSTVEGISPRGGMHACVAWNGELYWDPHPQDGTKHGLTRPMYYGVLLTHQQTPRWVRQLLAKQPGRATDAPSQPPYKPGDRIKLPNGRWTTVTKVEAAENLFHEPEWHVSTRTGEILALKRSE